MYKVCLYWKLTCNRGILGSPDRVSMDWAIMLFKNSCTADLKVKERINLKYVGAQTMLPRGGYILVAHV